MSQEPTRFYCDQRSCAKPNHHRTNWGLLDHPFMVILRVVYSWVYHPQVSSIVSHHFMGLSPALMVISMMSDQLPSLFSPYKACRNRGGHAQKAPAQGSESCAVWGCIAGLFQWVLTLFYGFTLWQWKTPANGG